MRAIGQSTDAHTNCAYVTTEDLVVLQRKTVMVASEGFDSLNVSVLGHNGKLAALNGVCNMHRVMQQKACDAV